MAFDSTEWSWKDMQIFLNGVRVSKIKKVMHKTAHEKEVLYGAGGEAFDVGSGNKAHTGELQIYSSQISVMNKAARALGHSDLTDVPWTISIVKKNTAVSPQEIITVPNVHFTEFEEGAENNEKASVKTLPYVSLAPTYQ